MTSQPLEKRSVKALSDELWDEVDQAGDTPLLIWHEAREDELHLLYRDEYDDNVYHVTFSLIAQEREQIRREFVDYHRSTMINGS